MWRILAEIVMGRHIAMAHENWPKDKADKYWKFCWEKEAQPIQADSYTPTHQKGLYRGQRIFLVCPEEVLLKWW